MTNQDQQRQQQLDREPKQNEAGGGEPATRSQDNPQGGMNQGTGPMDQGQPGGHAQQKGMAADVDAQLRGRGADSARSDEDTTGSAGATGTRQQGGGAERRGMGEGEDDS